MVARRNISRNEWTATERGAVEVVAPVSRPGVDEEESVAEAVDPEGRALDAGRAGRHEGDEEGRDDPRVEEDDADDAVPDEFAEAVRVHDLGGKRVRQRRFNVGVPRARAPEQTVTLRNRSER